MTHKIGVIGEKESVIPFQLFGFQVCYASEEKEVKQALAKLMKNSTIIYLTEKCAELIPDDLAKVQQKMTHRKGETSTKFRSCPVSNVEVITTRTSLLL